MALATLLFSATSVATDARLPSTPGATSFGAAVATPRIERWDYRTVPIVHPVNNMNAHISGPYRGRSLYQLMQSPDPLVKHVNMFRRRPAPFYAVPPTGANIVDATKSTMVDMSLFNAGAQSLALPKIAKPDTIFSGSDVDIAAATDGQNIFTFADSGYVAVYNAVCGQEYAFSSREQFFLRVQQTRSLQQRCFSW